MHGVCVMSAERPMAFNAGPANLGGGRSSTQVNVCCFHTYMNMKIIFSQAHNTSIHTVSCLPGNTLCLPRVSASGRGSRHS
jgi:hypothetical protein